MPGDAVKLGPFIGGMNTLSDPSGLEDNELVNITNLELDLDGSLISRPPIYTIAGPAFGSTRMYLLGWYINGATIQLIGCNSNGLWYYESGVWNVMTSTATVQSTAMVQYEGKAWIIATPTSVGAGGYWDGVTWTSVAAMPKGGSAVVHKERMYIVPGPLATGDAASLLRFTDPANFTTGWAAGNAVYVGKGDGQKLIDILVYNDNLMMFKNDSTYVYAFDNTPLQGVVRMVNNTIGVYDKNCVEQYENQLYLIHNKSVYEVSDYNFTKINYKVPFVYDATKPSPWADPVYVSVIGDRLFIKYFAKYYVYGLKTKTWSMWETGHYPGPWIKAPIRDETTAVPRYMAGSAVANQRIPIYEFVEEFGTNHPEEIVCKITTKTYDFTVPHKYKRLFWWGADIANYGYIKGKATPVVVNFGVTWGQLAAYTWDQLSTFTWGQPITAIPDVTTDYAASTLAPRKFVKFLKALRFREINFYLELGSGGLSTDSPVRIFSLTAIVSPKETVSKSSS